MTRKLLIAAILFLLPILAIGCEATGAYYSPAPDSYAYWYDHPGYTYYDYGYPYYGGYPYGFSFGYYDFDRGRGFHHGGEFHEHSGGHGERHR